MPSRFLKSSINITLLIGGVLCIYFLQSGLKIGLSVAGGVAFSVLNLYLMWKLIQETVTTEKKTKSNIAGLLVLKFIVLWGAFIASMALDWVNPVYFAIGFTVLLVVFSLKGFGGWIVDYFQLAPAKKKEED